jgi:hypothetical protein
MSFGEQLVLWLHIAVAVFTIGPVTLAISSTPRYIRKRDLAILRYLARITLIFAVGSLAVLILGIVLGQLRNEFSKPWLTAAMTLFLVAIALLILIIRDQRKAIRAVQEAISSGTGAPDGGPGAAAAVAAVAADGGQVRQAADGGPDDAAASGHGGSDPLAGGQLAVAEAAHLASVERGRIAAMGGIVNLIWLAVLALMVWQP